MALSGFTNAGESGVTIVGAPLEHRPCRFAPAYSGWGHAAVTLGGALAEHPQGALRSSGGAPPASTGPTACRPRAATRRAAPPRTRAALRGTACLPRGLITSRNNPGEAHEDGAAQPYHRHPKVALDQVLILRGGRDFAGLTACRAFVDGLVARRDRRR